MEIRVVGGHDLIPRESRVGGPEDPCAADGVAVVEPLARAGVDGVGVLGIERQARHGDVAHLQVGERQPVGARVSGFPHAAGHAARVHDAVGRRVDEQRACAAALVARSDVGPCAERGAGRGIDVRGVVVTGQHGTHGRGIARHGPHLLKRRQIRGRTQRAGAGRDVGAASVDGPGAFVDVELSGQIRVVERAFGQALSFGLQLGPVRQRQLNRRVDACLLSPATGARLALRDDSDGGGNGGRADDEQTEATHDGGHMGVSTTTTA